MEKIFTSPNQRVFIAEIVQKLDEAIARIDELERRVSALSHDHTKDYTGKIHHIDLTSATHQNLSATQLATRQKS